MATKTSETAAVKEAVGKRTIQMAHFATAQDRAKVAYENKPMVLGQLIGTVYAIKEKVGTLPSGEQKPSLLAIGEFEGVNYATGEVFESSNAYLPGYFAEAVQATLEKTQHGVTFAVELILEPTGKAIPVAYAVKNLISRQADHPLNAIKQALKASGKLRLPPPTTPQAIQLEAPEREPADAS